MTPEEELRRILGEQGELRMKLQRLELRIAMLGDRISAEADLDSPARDGKSGEEAQPELKMDEPASLAALSKAKIHPEPSEPAPDVLLASKRKPVGTESEKKREPVACKEPTAEESADEIAESLVPEPREPHLPSDPEAKDLEIKLGTYWFVRVGIFMLLTGFVFLANYAREHFFNVLSAPAKVAVLYGFAFGLLGVGLWLERRREELKNFGRVLAAGGTAAVYYTTFAAYKVESLRIIESPYVAGMLLLFWAAVMIVVSHRKQSQTLALMGVLLAYFTCVIIDRATMFSLFSALLLTGAGIVLLMVSRWVVVSFVSLAGTYLTFVYWRFPALSEWLLGRPADTTNFWAAYSFLVGYWVLFTFAVFATKREALGKEQRSAFATINNGAFLALFSLGMQRHYPDDLGLFLLIAGGALIALSELARRRFGDVRDLHQGYQIAGVLAVSVGAVMHFSGFQLALVLAGESIALLLFGKMRRSEFLNGCAYAVAALSAFYTLRLEMRPSLMQFLPADEQGLHWLAGLAQTATLIAGGWMIQRWKAADVPRCKIPENASLFVLFGLACAYFGPITDLPDRWEPPVLAVCGVAASCGLHFFRFREPAVLGLIYPVIAGLTYSFAAGETPLWAGALVWLSIGYLAYWLTGEGRIDLGEDSEHARIVMRDAFSIGTVVILGIWLDVLVEQQKTWLWAGGMIAILLLVTGMRVRLPALAVSGQIFHFAALIHFPGLLDDQSGIFMLVPIFMLVAGVAISARFEKPGDSDGPVDLMWKKVLWIAMLFFRIMAIFLLTAWVGQFVAAAWQALVLSLVALALAAWGMATGHRWRFVFAIALLVLGGLHWARDLFGPAPYYWPNALVGLVPLAIGDALRRIEKNAEQGKTFLGEEIGMTRNALAIFAVLMAWRFVSAEVGETFGGFYLTISWALLAFVVFAIGFGLQERVYRWLGLMVLTSAVARILIIDVWSLDPIPRIFSFVAIGLVLVTLGFVYNRYQDFIRRYL